MDELELPYSKLVSVYTDSYNVMRGIRGDFEKLLRQKIPHIVDIGGDTCHAQCFTRSVKVF